MVRPAIIPFSIPMTYLNPDLAKDMLRLIMHLTNGQQGKFLMRSREMDMFPMG